MKRTIIRHAIALDLVVVATGVALLGSGDAAPLIATFIGAVLVAALLGGRGPGFTATVSSLIVFGFVVGRTLRPDHYVLFAAAGTLLSLVAPTLRREAEVVPEPPALAPVRRRAAVERPWWLATALGVILVMIYTDVSEALIVAFGVPSLLQPLIVLLAIASWIHRDALRPARAILHPITLLLAGYCALLFVSSLWASEAWLADESVVKAVKNLFVYGVVAILASQLRALRNGLAILAISAAGLATLSIAQVLTGSRNDFGGLAKVAFGNIYEEQSDLRAAGPVGDANFYGQILIMVVPFALYLAYVATTRLQRIGWLGVALVITGGVLVTYSRGAMVGLAVMTGLVLIALRVPLTRVAAGTAVAVVLLLLMPGNVGHRFRTMVTLIPQETYYVAPESSLERRKLIASSGLQMFGEHPILGVGAGNFGSTFPLYANRVGSPADLFYEHGEMHLEHAHSLYLEVATETGMAGLLLFAALLVTCYLELRRTHRALAASGHVLEARLALALSVALSGFLVTSLFLHSGTQRYLFLLFALITAASCIAADAAEQPGEALPQ